MRGQLINQQHGRKINQNNVSLTRYYFNRVLAPEDEELSYRDKKVPKETPPGCSLGYAQSLPRLAQPGAAQLAMSPSATLAQTCVRFTAPG